MNRPVFTAILLCFFTLLRPAICEAGFYIHTNTSMRSITDNTIVGSITGESIKPHGHWGGFHGHVSHVHFGSGHWHGFAGHYHSHSFHPSYHPHYNWHCYHHPHYYTGFGDHGPAPLGILSVTSNILTPITLLAFGSLPAILVCAGGVACGGIGLLADKWKSPARTGLIIGATELTILATLYALYII